MLSAFYQPTKMEFSAVIPHSFLLLMGGDGVFGLKIKCEKIIKISSRNFPGPAAMVCDDFIEAWNYDCLHHMYEYRKDVATADEESSGVSANFDCRLIYDMNRGFLGSAGYCIAVAMELTDE